MPRKKSEFAEDSDEEKFEEVWDVKKIIAGVVIVVLLLFGGLVAKRLLLHQSVAPSSLVPHISLPSVKGLSSFNAPDQTSHIKITLPSGQEVQSQIQNIQSQVTHLNVADIASSSPQVQDILKQIENIPSGPESQVKDACIRLCNNL